MPLMDWAREFTVRNPESQTKMHILLIINNIVRWTFAMALVVLAPLWIFEFKLLTSAWSLGQTARRVLAKFRIPVRRKLER
jgi:hypothetical protein